ncbi:hypothetical protein [Rhodococcus baikonurensis]|uniref:Minor tail protein n=1 Tax=Rhodococcus baikonurensis TaxID=172041 RepID=A0ABV5X9L5_9NOCA
MGLFNRGQAASALILDGKRAVRAYLGEQLVWDGTMDAFVPIPHILVSATMADPVVSATALTAAPFITASAQVHEPSISGTATVRPETAILVTGAVYVPDVSADALIEVPAISVSAIVLAPTVSEAFDTTVEAPFIQVTAGMYSPKITADYAAAVPIIAAFAELLAPLVTATGTAVVNAPMIAVSGSVNAPTVIGSSSVEVPAIVASATVYAPEVRRDAKVLAPLIAGSSTLYAPEVKTGPTILVTDNFNRTAGALTTPWTRFVSWFQDSYQITATGTVKRNSGGTASADSFDGYIHGTALPGQNQYASLWVSTFGSSNGNPGPGLILRAGSTSAPALMGQVYYNTWRIITIAQVGAGGTPVVLKSGTGSFTAGGKIEMSVRNVAGVDTVSLSYKGVVLDTYSGTGLPTGLYHGFSTGEATNQVDDYAAGTA